MTTRALARLSFILTIALAQAQGDNKTPTLDPDAIQSGSFTDGAGALGAEAAQAPSLTSENNFINFCAGETLTNGFQITEGSCNGIVMGQIPAKNKMISAVITNPQNGDSVESGEEFNITVQVANLKAGAFTNAVATYYAAPQQVSGGNVVGHIHVTVQDTGSTLNPTEPLDATEFAFFKGINDAGDGQGKLSAVVTDGLPAGNYRLCTLISAANHQPVIMPVAQRGAQDDCVRFEVTGNVNTPNVAANDGEKGKSAAALAAQAITLGPGAPDPGGNAGAGNNNDDEDDSGTGAGNNNNNGGGNNNDDSADDKAGGGNNNGSGNKNNGTANAGNDAAGGNNKDDSAAGNGTGGGNNNGGGSNKDDSAAGNGTGGGNNNGGGGNKNNGTANAGTDDDDGGAAGNDKASGQGQKSKTASAASKTAAAAAGKTASAAADDKAAKDDTASAPASAADAAATAGAGAEGAEAEEGKGKGKGKARARSARLARLSRRHFVA